MEKRTIRKRNLIAYGIGDLYGGGSFFIISTFAMFYLINVVGLSPILAGLIPGLGKVWDAVSDPLMGYITDNTKSRFGRRRVFFLIAIFPVALSFILLWLPVRFDSQIYTFLYYFMAYLFFYTVSTMTMVPYSALPAEMTVDFKERNSLGGARMIFSIIASLLGGVLVQPIINGFADPAEGHMVMGLAFGVFYALPWIFVFMGTWELPDVRHESDMNMSLFQNFRSILNNRTFRLHIGMYICSYASMDVLMSWFKFYLIDYLGRTGLVSICLGAIVLAEIAALPFYIRVANRQGHGRAYMIGLVLWAAGTMLLALQTPGTPTVLFVLNCVLVGAGLSAGVVIPWTALPFVTDVDEMITTKKRAGTYSGSMTLIRKMIQGAFVLPLLGILLTAIGYIVPTQEQIAQKVVIQQGAETIFWIRLLFIATPLALMAFGIFFSSRFRISPRTHEILMREIERLKGGGRREDVDPEARSVCEELTGMKYEELYK